MFSICFNTCGPLPIQDDSLYGRSGNDGKVLGRVLHQVLCRRAHAVGGGADQQRHPERIARVVVWVEREPCLLERVEQRRKVLLTLGWEPDFQGPGRAMVTHIGRGVFLTDAGWWFAMEALQRFEPGMHPVPLERLVVHDSGPFLVVVAGADGEDAEVDGGGTAHAFSSGIVQLTVIAVDLWGCFITPAHVRILFARSGLVPSRSCKTALQKWERGESITRRGS